MRMLMWFRRDLRVCDNVALDEATRASSEGVVAVYCLTPEQWREHDESDAKVHFWLANLRELAKQLKSLHIPLRVVQANRFDELPQKLLDVAQELNCHDLFFNREYEVNEQRRDAAVEQAFTQEGREVRSFHDRVLLPPDIIRTQQGKPYTVFTPYRKRWIEEAEDMSFNERPVPAKQARLDVESDDVPATVDGFEAALYREDLWPAGEQAAAQRLDEFINNRIKGYDDHRDFPAINGTSLMSPYLAAGVVSPRQCLHAGVAANQGSLDRQGWGATTWLSELVWREFYNQVMVHYPRVCMHRPFQQDTERLQWREDESGFEAWAEGRTGYPIVDAAMRQLNQTGWMHNRLRMVAAMFLTKHLLIDWRLGERYFMRHLIDGDLASNNGGWQWSASTGTDAVPYFRIFNPYSQSQRFDVEGKFIRRFCPELESVPAAALHDPKKLDRHRDEHDYPAPVVEHSAARKRALEAFKALKQ